MIAVLIPHCRRNADLERCLRSVVRSTESTGIAARIYVADPDEPCWDHPLISWVGVPETTPYNKSLSSNAALDAALADGCEVVACIDCDMIVGRRWLAACRCARRSHLHRVAFAVKRLPHADPDDIDWDTASRRFESWGIPWCDRSQHRDRKAVRRAMQPYGCSAWAARPAALMGQRWDEKMTGHGFEDLEYTCRVAAKIGPKKWRAVLFDSAATAIWHVEHEPLEWAAERPSAEQMTKFARAKTLWERAKWSMK
jgi:hypothetical protein